MNVIIDGRGSGKAKKLLEAAEKTPRSIILAQDKRAFEVKAKSYGFHNVKIIDYNDLKNDNYPLDATVFVHNGDKLLYYLLDKFYGLTLSGFTATIENKEIK